MCRPRQDRDREGRRAEGLSVRVGVPTRKLAVSVLARTRTPSGPFRVNRVQDAALAGIRRIIRAVWLPASLRPSERAPYITLP